MQTAHWYFGEYAGVDFTNGPPVADINGQIDTKEGCTSISDEYGNLLFYTSGRIIYDRTHNIMENGTGLRGDSSSTSSAIILPKPDDCNLYYVFTIDVQDAEIPPYRPRRGMEYNIVDMSLNGGLGAVIQKNIEIPINGQQQGHEKLAAISNNDKTGYWVITHFQGSFFSFSVTGDGVDLNPVVSSSSINPPTIGAYGTGLGYLKGSPDGTKLAMGMSNDNYNEIIGSLSVYNFNNETGIVSNEIILSSPGSEEAGFYAIEFSSDSKALYTESIKNYDPSIGGYRKKMIQYDLGHSPIADSKYVISEYVGYPAAMQRGPDGKIYISKVGLPYLNRIDNPETIYNPITGEGPTLVNNAVFLINKRALIGLPTFLNHYFRISITINGLSISEDQQYCTGYLLDFNFCHQGGEIESINWDFGDGEESTEMYPQHYYNSPGAYTITLRLIVDGEEYIRTFEITITGPPNVEDAEQSICLNEGEEHTFNLEDSIPDINTENGDYTITFHLTQEDAENNENPQPSTYVTDETTIIWVRVEDENGCFVVRELHLIVDLIPEVTVESPVEICIGTSTVLEVITDSENTVHWYDSEDGTTPIFTGNPFTTPVLTETTSYWAEAVSAEGCVSERIEVIAEVTDSIIPIFDLQTQYCQNTEPQELPTTSDNGITGSWFPGAIDTSTAGTQTYTFTPDEGQCATGSEMTVEVIETPELTLPEVPEICSGETVTITITTTGETVNWYEDEFSTIPFHTGITYTTPPLTESATYWIEAADGECISERLALFITVNELPEIEVENPDPVCVGNSVELSVLTNGEIINWYDSEDGTTPIFIGNPFITPELNETTSYWAEAVSEAGCVSERIEVIAEITDSIIPIFDLQSQYCQNTEPQELPTTSDNGITGSWNPSVIDTSTAGTQTYIFTPDEGQCATDSEMTVEVVETPELVLPEAPEICSGETITLNLSTTGETVNWYEDEFSTIPFHSGIAYTTPPLTESATYWIEAATGECISERLALVITVNELPEMEAENPNPICVGNSVELSVLTNGEIVNWYDSETAVTPIFTGNPFTTPLLTETTSYWAEAVSEAGCLSERIEVTVEVTDSIIPIFDLQYQYCLDAEPQELPTTSDNGITGSWLPGAIDTSTVGTQTYTFTPDEGQCAEIYPITIETAESTAPVFSDLPEIYCFNSQAEALPAVSDNGISGSWYPGEINTGIQGVTGYVFTPDGNQCSEPYELVVTVYPYPDMELEDDIVICSGDSYSYLAPEGFDYYIWTDSFGNVLSETREIIFTEEGVYTLTVEINGIPCMLSRNIEVSFSTTPIITEIKSTENTLTVYATGNGPFEYSLDEIFWQSSNVFYNLEPGIYFVYVRDGKGCGSSARQGAIMGVPNFISPNGDGKNDTWKIRALAGFPNTRLQIFDRYGKMFVDRILDGDFEWDGRYNREPLPSGTYWYILILEDGEKLSGHINLRNY